MYGFLYYSGTYVHIIYNFEIVHIILNDKNLIHHHSIKQRDPLFLSLYELVRHVRDRNAVQRKKFHLPSNFIELSICLI